MDLFSLGFLLLILAASGGIAYAADRLGKKLGKKRLSLKVGKWSLRPKHVAALGTVVMGIGVSFLTIVFIALVSRDAREWLIEGRGLLVQREELKRDVKDQRNRLAQLTVEIARNQERYAELGSNFKGLQARYVQLETELTRLNAQLKDGAAALKKSQSELTQSQALLAIARRQLPPLRAQIAIARAQVATAKAELATTQTSLITTTNKLATVGKNLNTALKRLNEAYKKGLEAYQKQKDLEVQVDALKKDVEDREAVAASLRKETATLVAERDSAEASAQEAQQRLAGVQARLEQAGRDLNEVLMLAQSQGSLFKANLKSSRLEPMTFRAREEVARYPLPANSTPDDTARALTSLLRGARIEATSRGAKAKQGEVADVFDRIDPDNGAKIPASDLKNAVVVLAAGRLQDQVLVATSSYNAFAGEAVSLEIAVAPNPVVFHRNDTIAEARIDGSKDEGRIFDQLSLFVQSRVRESAAGRKMVPREGTDAPYGQINASDLLNVVRDIKRTGRSVRVQALAKDETRAADTLRLEFRLR